MSSEWARSKLEKKLKRLQKSRQRFQDIIKQHENEIARSTSEIDRIDQRLKDIRAEYAKIVNESSVVLKLPTEVACMIFEFAAATHCLEDRSEGLDHTEKTLLPEVVISQVCRHWRDVALNYPRLWTRFYFLIDNVKFSMKNSLTRFNTYISRSGSQSLELYLDFAEWPGRPLQRRPPRHEQFWLLERVMEQIKRWRIVTLLATKLRLQSHFPCLTTSSAPNLEYFVYSPGHGRDLHDQSANPQIKVLTPSLLQGGAPKLRYFSLDCTTAMTPALSNITTLLIQPVVCHPVLAYSWNTFLELLSIPSLANLSIFGNIFRLDPATPTPLIEMNNLKHLRYCDSVLMTHILTFLRVPLLETLVIREDQVEQRNELGCSPDSYFFPSLTSLTLICAAPSSFHSVRHAVQLTKNIERLTVSHELKFFRLLENYADRFEEDECWPKLTCITVNRPSKPKCARSICNFALSRQKGTLKLQLNEELDSNWREESWVIYQEIQSKCTVEVLDPDAETALLGQSWPPDVGVPHYALWSDPFNILCDEESDSDDDSNQERV